jgi:photosystem II stability/assembly factor-like uncharacterized protein
MRPIFVALLASVALVPPAAAGDLRNFGDAPLRAVQFVDRNEGWAVGDEGVVWHSIDGGQSWERQSTGVRASLRSVHFLNPYTGWIAGREELPNGTGSTGVLLFTRDGGLNWRPVTLNTLPGLNRVRFLDNKNGYLLGDGSEPFPTGMFVTTDSGRSWQPLPGPRCPSWLDGDFQDLQTGSLAGAWNRLAAVRGGKIIPADIDTLGGRSLLGLQLQGEGGVAVGNGGLVLLKDDKAGLTWSVADLKQFCEPKLTTEILASLDFHAVCCAGDHVWVVGRPGSVILHSTARGTRWEMLKTGQNLPLNGVFFIDEKTGWAVGELGTILATEDGGKNWKVQRRGGQRAALLFVHARPAGLPCETLAILGGEEGYLTAALRVAGSDPTSAVLGRATEAQRFAAAVRQAGGAAGEMLWQFPVAQHLARSDPPELVRSWDWLHADRAADELLRQLVLTLRIWKPDVIVTDHPDAKVTGFPSETIVAEAVREAFKRASDPKAFPEQLSELGLEVWEPARLYARWEGKAQAQVVIAATEICPRLESSARDFAAPAAALLIDSATLPPAERTYHLLASRTPGAETQRGLLDGLPPLAAGGLARRTLPEKKEMAPEVLKGLQARRNLQAISEQPENALGSPEKLLSQIGPMLEGLPDHQAAPAAFAVANQYVRQGQWALAREAFLLMVERYPNHPLTADACRWLIRYGSSSEARRRHELKQFVTYSTTEFKVQDAPAGLPKAKSAPKSGPQSKPKGAPLERVSVDGIPNIGEQVTQTRFTPGEAGDAARAWYQGSLDLESRLTALGPLFVADPSVQFCLQAARRNIGDFAAAQKWYSDFASRQPDGPWRSAAQAELWLNNRTGLPPKPLALCWQTDTRPFLDGKLEEDCWQGHKPMVLRDAVGKTAEGYPTEAWLAYDQDFLYIALRCRHPADRYVAPVKARPRDADLRPYDRVSILLDMDRDYTTCYHLQIDQRGCLCEDCWGDLRWNPRWFVAIKSDKSGWQVEAAIPLKELTGDRITVGRAWACNIVRVLPGRGVQAWSAPADVQPRPEGMGLLLFAADPREPARPPMSKAP